MGLEKMVFNFDSKKFIGQSAINNKPLTDGGKLEEVADITVQDAGLINIFNLRGSQRSSIFRQVIQSSLDIQIPNKTGTFTTNDKKFILQTSPDEWVILSETKDINIKSVELEKKLTKVNYALTNLTDQYQVVYIFGEKSRWVLSKGISIDLDSSSFGPKQCAQTTLALTDISIFCTAKNSFTVFCRNSFANYLIDWIEDASFDCKYKFLKS
tara:strand:- start:597 stop:1232 length:636 start_codon:yes stop_codon:yes gene_type:complete